MTSFSLLASATNLYSLQTGYCSPVTITLLYCLFTGRVSTPPRDSLLPASSAFYIIKSVNLNINTITLKKKISHRLGPLRGSSSPFGPLSQRGLNPIKPVYDPDWPDSRLNLTASAFNQLGQYTSSPATQNSPFSSLSVAVTIASTHRQ